MKNTKIEWCDHTINFWWGCSEVSEACQNCYAREIAKRFKKDCWGLGKARSFRDVKALSEIRALNHSAEKRKVVETVFINSMSDFFEDASNCKNTRSYAYDCFFTNRNLVFLILTKRPQNIENTDVESILSCGNVRLGITAENQRRLDERMESLKDFKDKVFLSCEPLLEEIDITHYLDRIDWVICGGESGRKARHFNPMWAQKIFEDTHKFDGYTREWASIVPFFFKQFGDNKANVKKNEDWWVSTIREYPEWHYRNPQSLLHLKNANQSN